MILKVQVDKVYGKTVIYPVNKEARALAEIAGTKTLTPATLRTARDGFGAEVFAVNTSVAQLAEILNA